jgi:hypothetical protein
MAGKLGSMIEQPRATSAEDDGLKNFRVARFTKRADLADRGHA